MTGQEKILARLTDLLEKGALPKTVCSAALIRTLQPLLAAGVVIEERAGGGRRLVVRDLAKLREFREVHFPDTPLGGDHASRTAGVARFRDSKTFANDTPEIISVRAWSEEALRKNGKPCGAALASSGHGVFSFLLSADYSLRGVCALVENPAVFHQFERLHSSASLVVRYSGCVDGRLLDWLAANDAPDFSLLHLPDYDPVGLREFTRLRGALGPRVELYGPDDLAERFARFSSRRILQKPRNRTLLAELRTSQLDEVRRVVALIDRHNACLEQETLLFTTDG